MTDTTNRTAAEQNNYELSACHPDNARTLRLAARKQLLRDRIARRRS